MIEIAGGLSAALRHWADLIIIAVLLVFNEVIGFWEEYQAGNAIEQLKRNLALKARVLRNRKSSEIDAPALVPGDIVRLRLGDVIPADLKLFEGDYLSVDQSALTGESLPVDKKAGDAAYSGSVAKQGEMVGVVTATGMNTYFGRTARLVSSAQRFAFSACRAEYRRLLDLPIVGTGRGADDRRARPRAPADPARTVRADSDRRLDPGCDAGGLIGDDGNRSTGAFEDEGHRIQARVDRGDGRDGRAVLGQDRHPDAKPTHPW